MAVIFTDHGGSLVVFKKQDESSMIRYEMAYGKAYASLAMGRLSSSVRYRADQRPLFIDYLLKASKGKIFEEDGDMLIRETTGDILGAVGVTGERPERDEELANIGIKAASLLTDHDAADLGRKARLEN